MKQVLVIHDGDFFDSRAEFVDSLKKERVTKEDLIRKGEKRWKDNLPMDLGKEFEILYPQMPNYGDAKYVEWKIWFEKAIPFLKDGVVLLGHSLGGIFLARYLSENNFPKKIGGLFLVAAPFYKPGKKTGMNANAGFSLKDDLSKVEKQVSNIFIYHSSDDPIVPVKDAKVYKKFLPSSKLILLHGLGHFRQEHFLELISQIKELSA